MALQAPSSNMRPTCHHARLISTAIPLTVSASLPAACRSCAVPLSSQNAAGNGSPLMGGKLVRTARPSLRTNTATLDRVVTAPPAKQDAPFHPLNQLSPDEIRQVAAVCKAHASELGIASLRFNVISLQEPAKKALVAYERGVGPLPPRQAFCVLQLPVADDFVGLPGVVEVLVNVLPPGKAPSSKQVVSWTKVDGVSALATPDDCFEAEAIAKADPEVQRLLKERYGITDMALVACDPWSVHANPVDARVIQTFMYMRSNAKDNMYAHPLDMTPLVDMTKRKVIRIDLPYKEAPAWNREDNNYHRDLQGPTRTDIKPLNIVQPQGPSFSVEGSLVRWQKWEVRVGFNYREGLVLHNLGYRDNGTLRPVAHRLSLVEMAVPYGDPREPFVRKCAFDVGDYGLGYCTFPLSLGCDCLGDIHYFDATLINTKGEPVKLPKAVCMHEEDVGLMSKHVDYRTGHSEARRSRRLVLSFIATVVNYEYAIYWYLYQDGTIGHEIKLTGELSTNMLSPGENQHLPDFGTLVGPGVNAQHHQHMFCARLDMAVDDAEGGKGVELSEVHVESLPADPVTNPYGNGFRAVEKTLDTVHNAQRNIAPEMGRIWKFKNPAKINPITHQPIAYKLMPMAHPGLMSTADSLITKKGHFATKQLWVTPHHDKQNYPAGDYVLGAKDCTGLSQWTKQDAPLANADPVAWYSYGVTHIVRVEDFPIMPVETCGFHLKPFGFFNANPALDLPHDPNTASRQTVHAAPGESVPSCCGSNGSSANTSGDGHAEAVNHPKPAFTS